jgi:Lanthionine synthetase C-like protein
MKEALKYSSSDLKNLIVYVNNHDMPFSTEQFEAFGKAISNTNNENLTEISLDLLVWIYFQHKEKPLNLSFFEHKLFEYGLRKISDKQFSFDTGCGGVINYFLTSTTSTNYVELLLDALVKNNDFEQSLSCSTDFQESDLSLSSGTTGILLLLLNLFERSKNSLRIVEYVTHFERIFLQTIKCLLVHILPVSERGQATAFFPDYVKIKNQETVYIVENTLAWAKGDLPKIYLLYKAGHYFKKQAWINLADNMGEYISGLDYGQNLNVSIAEGTAGGALMYRKLFELTNKTIYQEAHQYWLHETLENMKASKPNLTKSLLSGKSGAYLTLQSSLDKDYGWAKILLL